MIHSLNNRTNMPLLKANKKNPSVSFSGNTAPKFNNSGYMNNTNRVVTTLGKISKCALVDVPFRAFDFIKGQLSIASAGLITFGIVLGARVYQARGKDEKREVVTRDFSAIATILFALPVMKKACATITRLKTGIAMAYNPHKGDEPNRNIAKKFWDHLRPVQGYSVFSYDDLEKLYSGDKFMEKMHKISEYRGNLSKILKTLAPDNSEIKAIFDNLGSDRSLNTINEKFLNELKTNKKLRNTLEKEFMEKENNIVKYASKLKTIPEVASVALICSVLGWGLPWLNIWYTRGLYKNPQKHNKDTASMNTDKAVNTTSQINTANLSSLAQQILKSKTVPKQNSQVK